MELWNHLFVVIVVELSVHATDNSSSASELLQFQEDGIANCLELDAKVASAHAFPTSLKFYK